MSNLSCVLPAICICLVGQALAEPPQVEPQQPTSQASATSTATSSSTATASPATSPSKESSAPVSGSSNATTTASSSAGDTPKPTNPNKVVLVDKTITDSQVKQLLSQGYRPQSSGDGVIYCRRETELNSHFERKVCRSADAILTEMNDSRDMLKHMQQPLGSPSGH